MNIGVRFVRFLGFDGVRWADAGGGLDLLRPLAAEGSRDVRDVRDVRGVRRGRNACVLRSATDVGLLFDLERRISCVVITWGTGKQEMRPVEGSAFTDALHTAKGLYGRLLVRTFFSTVFRHEQYFWRGSMTSDCSYCYRQWKTCFDMSTAGIDFQ